MGAAYKAKGDFVKAKINFKKSLFIRIYFYGAENNIDVAKSYTKLGLLYKEEGNFDKAKIVYEKSL